MAKSKSGGTRAYIRGRVGADVYSIGKTANGKKQQVVRSLAETVANPQTTAQMRGRMIMSTIMQALAVLRPIVDHSFDNVTGVQPNLSEFIRRNYALIKADVAANPASGNSFGLVAYGEKVAKQGCYIISDGKAAIPAAVTMDKSAGVLSIDLGENDLTMAGLKSALGIGSEGYMTIVGLTTTGLALYARLHVNYSLGNDEVISADTLSQAFQIDGNATPTLSLAEKIINVTLADVAKCCSCIITRKSASGFIHSKATLGNGNNFEYPSSLALPTYPVGEQKFLNGGGDEGSVINADSGDIAPTPQARTLTITKASGVENAIVSVNGNAISSGDSVMSGSQVSIQVTAPASSRAKATINGAVVSLTGSVGGQYNGSFYMPDAAATLAISAESDGGEGDGD